MTLAPWEECEGDAFGSVCLSVCLSGHVIRYYHPRSLRGVRGLCIWVCLFVCLSVWTRNKILSPSLPERSARVMHLGLSVCLSGHVIRYYHPRSPRGVRGLCIWVCLFVWTRNMILSPSLPERSARVMHLGLSVCLSGHVVRYYHPRSLRGVRGWCIWVCLFVCLSVRTRNSCPDTQLKKYYCSSDWSASGLNNLLRDRTKYAIKVCHQSMSWRRALQWKHALPCHMCIIASQGMSSINALLLLFYKDHSRQKSEQLGSSQMLAYTPSHWLKIPRRPMATLTWRSMEVCARLFFI